jgi:hypothetical protein
MCATNKRSVVRGEPHVLRGRRDHVGDHAGLQAPHPVRQYRRRLPEHLEALGLVAAISSAANRTNRNRDQASTEQNT